MLEHAPQHHRPPEEQIEGFYLDTDIIKDNKESITDFFGDNRVDREGGTNWYKKLLEFGVSLDSQEDFLPADEYDLPPLDPERILMRAGKISEFFKHDLAAQAAYLEYISKTPPETEEAH